MRKKHLVNFRAKMLRASTAGRGGKKRASDGDQSPPSKARRTEARVDGGWRRSKCIEKDLLRLVAEGLLRERSTVEWCPASKDESPFELTGETVFFTLFAERGLALLPSIPSKASSIS
jgi:hypothetical protein